MHWIIPERHTTSGTLDRVLPDMDGEPDGVLLADGRGAHMPPRGGAVMTSGGTVIAIKEAEADAAAPTRVAGNFPKPKHPKPGNGPEHRHAA